jgi:hypothetical protein
MLLPQPQRHPEAFQKLLNFWRTQGLFPAMGSDTSSTQTSLKLKSKSEKQKINFWGGLAIQFSPRSVGTTKIRAVLLEIFGAMYWDPIELLLIVPFVHASDFRSSIKQILNDFILDLGATAAQPDSIETPTILDGDVVFIGYPASADKAVLMINFIREKSVWPLTAKKLADVSKLFELIGIKSKYQIKNFQDFLSLCRDIPQEKMDFLSKFIPGVSELTDQNLSQIQWQSIEAPLKVCLKNYFPWGVFDDLTPPTPLKIPTLVAIDAEKLLLLYLVREPSAQLKTVAVADFFKKHGLLLTTDQVTACLKNFAFIESSGAKLGLEYKVRGKNRVWVIIRQVADGILMELSINPFYL